MDRNRDKDGRMEIRWRQTDQRQRKKRSKAWIERSSWINTETDKSQRETETQTSRDEDR